MKRSFWIVLSLLLILGALLTACGKDTKKSSLPQEKETEGTTEGTAPAKPSITAPNPPSEPAIPSIFEQSTPIIRIQTEGGISVPENKTEIECTVTLESSVKQHCESDLSATIRTRGNGSLSVGKNTGKLPYKLDFAEKINPFDLGDGEADEWVLLNHVGDQSMLRNYTAKRLGDMLSGIPYSPNARLVIVYLNGEYIGIYELCEQIEAGQYRVDVDDGYGSAENGFLVELDEYADDIYVRVGGQYYTVKSEVYSQAQLTFIKDYLQDVHDAVYAGDKDALWELVDMDSLVDTYLLQEFTKNIDVGWSSFFMYREVGGKLIFGAPWDFDLALGNDARLDNGSVDKLYVGTGRKGFAQNHEWYIELYTNNEWFRELAAERWAEISDTVIVQLIEEVKQMAEYIAPDMEDNYKRWQFFGKKLHQEPPQIVSLKTYKEHTDYLISWMQNRKVFLDSELAAGAKG